MSRVMIVEFIGPPGSGKTTLTRHIQDYLESNNYRCMDIAHFTQRVPHNGLRKRFYRIKLSFDAAIFFWCHPLLVLDVSRFAAALDLRNIWVRKLALIMLKQCYMFRKIKHVAETKGFNYVIFDQHIMQTMWSMMMGNPKLPEKELKRLMSRLREYLAPITVQCQLDSNTAYHRMTTRKHGWSRFCDMEKEVAISILDDRSCCFTTIAQIAREMIGCTLLTVDTKQDVIEVRDQIGLFLAQINQTIAKE